MRYNQIGNGSAFNYKMPNSSFLIENNNKYLLFDCGHSVYAELRKQDEAGEIDLKKLDSIYISHMDDDHMGSLKTLLYYQYFVNGITTKVYAHAEVYDAIEELLRQTNFKRENGKFVPAPIVEVRYFNFNHPIIRLIGSVSPCHHHTTCYGLHLRDYDGTFSLLISGDTKATPELSEVMENMVAYEAPTKIFHDFSNWDCEGSQVHACKTDTEYLYSPDILKAITWYHNDAEFNKEWCIV